MAPALAVTVAVHQERLNGHDTAIHAVSERVGAVEGKVAALELTMARLLGIALGAASVGGVSGALATAAARAIGA